MSKCYNFRSTVVQSPMQIPPNKKFFLAIPHPCSTASQSSSYLTSLTNNTLSSLIYRTCGIRILHLGEHVLQAVAELVEQRLHFAEGHQRGTVAYRGRAVAHEVGHRLLAQHLRSAHAHVHPRVFMHWRVLKLESADEMRWG